MGNGFLTWSALAIATLINAVFFSKKRIKNSETKIFKYMLIFNIIESLITNLIVIVALTINHTKTLVLLNRLDVMAIISWCSLMFYYIYVISRKDKFKLVWKGILTINITVYLLSLFLDVTIINSNGIMDSQGPLTTLGLIGACIYICLMIITVTYKNNRKIQSKYIPLYIFIILIIFVATLRIFIPEINFISFLLSFVNLIMIFTIENPDVKMVNELIENRKIIERTSEEKSVFLFKMSQGLREEVNNIDKQVDLYKKGNLNEEEKDLVIENIDKNNQKINYLINDVLGINSFDSSNIKKLENAYNIYTLLEDINKRGAQYKYEEVDYRFTIVDNIPKELYGDSIKLKQVLMSVLINALENTKEGFVHVDVNSFTKYDICRIMITIEDSGTGISITDINNILDQDLELTEQDYLKIEKLDVDLPLAYKMIKMLGGTMYIKSEEDKGTEVIITIDQYIVINEEVKDNNKIDNYIKTRKRGNKILLVNDNEDEIRRIKRVLEKKDYDVVTSMFGQDAIDRIRNKEKYDVILIDDEMPLMNGINVLDELVKLKNKSKKIVLLEKDKLFIAHHYVKDGFNNYIDKSHLVKELDEKIK